MTSYNVTSSEHLSNFMAAVSQEEQREYIKIEYLRGKTGMEIYENLHEACRKSLKTVCRWLECFSDGNWTFRTSHTAAGLLR